VSYLVKTTNLDTKRDVKVIKTTCSSLTEMSHSSFQGILGGTVEYTPSPNSTHVYYEYNTMLSYKDQTASSAQFKLLYGSDTSNLTSISSNDVNYIVYVGSGAANITSGYEQEEIMPLKISFLIPAWSGTKVLVLQGKENSASREYYLHGIRSGTTGESNHDLFDPFCIVYSI